MTSVLRASFLNRGRRLIFQTNFSNSRQFTCLDSRSYQRQEEKKESAVPPPPPPPPNQAELLISAKKNLVSNKRERLYDGMLNKKIRFVKMFSLATSGASLLCQPYLISKAVETGSNMGVGGICLVFGFFAFVTPLMLHLITKRYVVHVDYDPWADSYVATTYSIFAQKKEIEFKPEDVKLPNMSEMLTSCFIKGIPMFMDVKYFTNIDHYKRIMGFDKPMDFILPAQDAHSETKK